MQKQKPAYFSILTAAVRYDKDLIPNAKLLYSEISALCNQTGECWAANDYFSNLFEVEKETISRWISALKRNGHIGVKVDRKSGNKRAITLLTKKSRPIDEKVKTLLTKKSRPIDEKVNPIYRNNNTINNTINREGKSLAFLEQNFAFRYETDFLMKYKSQIKNWDKFCLDFDDTVELEKLPFDASLFGRLGKYARNWIVNQNRFVKNENENTRTDKIIGNGI